MAERLDALSVRESNGKSYWTKIGVAFPAKQGTGWSIMLDAMPAPTDGQFKIMLREPLPRDGQRPTDGGRANHGINHGLSNVADDLSDEVPF